MKKTTRRDLALLLPALSLAARAQEPAKKAPPKTLTSHSYIFEDLPVKADPAPSQKKTRPVAKGILHNGFGLDIHETELGPGRSRTRRTAMSMKRPSSSLKASSSTS